MRGTICVIGYLAQDIVFRTKANAIHEDLTEGDIAWATGGTAVNVASWLTSLDVTANLIAMTGTDPVAESMIREIEDFGVHVTVTAAGRTPVVLSVVAGNGDRQLLVDNGGPFTQAAFPMPQLSLDWIHIPGHVLMRKDLSEQCLDWLHAAPRTARRSVDVCSASRLRAFGVSRFMSLLGELEIGTILMNGMEAAELGGRDAVAGIAPIAIIHNGPEASHLWADGTWDTVSEGIDPGALVIDTTGAGDAFAAGFIAASVAGAHPRAATIAGHAAAQRAIALVGGNPLGHTA